MQKAFAFLCVWLVSTVIAGHSVESTTQSPGGVQQPSEELREMKNILSAMQATCNHDGGGVVAQLMQQLFTMNEKLHSLESSLLATRTDFEAAKSKLKAEIKTTKGELGSQITALSTSRSVRAHGSSFIRWGRKSCPDNTTLVYAGVAGGKEHNQKGSGTNRLCLTRTPQFDNTAKPSGYGYLYGAEYQHISGHHDHDVPCSVCLAPQSTTIMVPATLTCPPGWTPHYTGHLASQYKDYYATEYVCLDGSPEADSSGVRNDNGLLFYYVMTVCGSLPCPPYINDKVVTCVVCSK